MKYKLGKTNIVVESEINGFRSKMLQILELLTRDKNYSIRMASLISTFLKSVRIEGSPLAVKSHILFHDLGGSYLYLEIRGELKDHYNLLGTSAPKNFRVNAIEGGIDCSFHGNFKTDRLEEIKRVYKTKSKLELMSKLQNRNEELKTSLINLKTAKDLNARMEQELEVGREIQLSMLPLNFPSNEHFDLFAKLVPAREVGGDFYDFQLIDDQHLYFVVGDVSGKGVPAALLMAVTKTMLKSSISSDLSTAQVISRVNNELSRDNEKCMFITIFMAILDFKNGVLRYTNAGHNPSYFCHNGEIKMLDVIHGPVVGAIEGIEYGEEELKLEQDGVLFAYTDGVTEAQDRNGTLYSDAKLIQFIESNYESSVRDLIDDVILSVHEHELNTEQSDDITAMALRFNYTPDQKSLMLELKIENRIDSIPEACNSVEEFMSNNGFGAKAPQVNIILDEILSNTIRYAYGDTELHWIEVDAEIENDKLILTFQDDGKAFDPFKMDSPDTALGVEERDIGGLGVHIVKSLAQEYNYTRKDDKNIIKLIISKT
jgi:sigma-B regulation protein RsbU (phosphoserine phosphatase)